MGVGHSFPIIGSGGLGYQGLTGSFYGISVNRVVRGSSYGRGKRSNRSCRSRLRQVGSKDGLSSREHVLKRIVGIEGLSRVHYNVFSIFSILVLWPSSHSVKLVQVVHYLFVVNFHRMSGISNVRFNGSQGLSPSFFTISFGFSQITFFRTTGVYRLFKRCNAKVSREGFLASFSFTRIGRQVCITIQGGRRQAIIFTVGQFRRSIFLNSYFSNGRLLQFNLLANQFP